MALGLADGVHAEVENAGSQDRVGLACVEDIHHVIEVSRAAAGDDRNADGGGHGGC